jgi:uncharacterized protein (TIGR02246 family)
MFSATACRIGAPTALFVLLGGIAASECSIVLGHARARAGESPGAPVQAAVAPADARNEDRATIRATLESFVKALESRDAKAVAAHWAAEGEHKGVQGTRIRGREAIEKAFAGYFARSPEPKLEVRPETLRFLSTDSAIEEGTFALRRGSTEAPTRARYSALLVRENGRWMLALLDESPGDSEGIADLEWLIGAWKSAPKGGAEFDTTYSWHPNKKFIVAQFTIKEKDRTFSGTQVIGVDPATGALHSWTFEADGGVGEADWRRDGDHWVLDASGTLADGRPLTETNVLRRVNNDTITWQSVDRLLDDDPIADLPPVKATRLKAGN